MNLETCVIIGIWSIVGIELLILGYIFYKRRKQRKLEEE